MPFTTSAIWCTGSDETLRNAVGLQLRVQPLCPLPVGIRVAIAYERSVAIRIVHGTKPNSLGFDTVAVTLKAYLGE